MPVAGERWREPGWLLLPLRAFLGVTFTFAGLQKLANPTYLDPSSPMSVAHQMLLLRHRSPIGPLLGLSAHAPTAVGLLIAFGELAVGVATLLGLWARAAAAGGALLALTFFLTVSWSTRPYYYGSDIVFVFAWSVLLAFGTGGVLSVDAWLRARARRDLRLAPEAASVAVQVPRLRTLCGRGAKCGLDPSGRCTRLQGCPVFPVQEQLSPAVHEALNRRTVVLGAAAAALVGVVSLLAGGLTAALGRAAGGTSTRRRTVALAKPAPSTPGGSPQPALPGTEVGLVSALAVGQGLPFTYPADGSPAWVVRPSTDSFVAFSAVCTHAGCTVDYDPGGHAFVCPCHNGVYDGRTGQVLAGPPPAPLTPYPVRVVDGQIRVL